MKLSIHIHSAKAIIIAEYSRRKLKKISLRKGTLTAEQWLKIGLVIPSTEDDLEIFKKRLNGVVTFEILEQTTPTLYHQFLNSWFDFYERFAGFPPKFTAIDGKHLKQIIAYLQNVSADNEDALNTWSYVLGNWDTMDEFHKKNTDLKYINSQLNKILQNAKQRTSKNTTRYSDDFKRAIIEGLQS